MTRKRRLATTVIAIALIAIGGEVLVESIAVDGVLRLVENKLSKATGLEVRAGGDFHLEIVPVLHFEANAVTVTDPQEPSHPLLTVGSLILEIDPWQLLFGVISIDELELHHSELILDSGAVDGSRLAPDAEPLAEKTPSEPEGEGTLFLIHRLDAKDLRIVYRAGTVEPSASLEIDDLSLEAEEFDEPFSVSIRGSMEGSRFEVEGELGALQQLSNPTAAYPVSLRARIGKTETELVGSIQDPLAMRGVEMDVRLAANDLRFLEPFVEWPRPEIDSLRAEASLSDRNGDLGIAGSIHATAGDGQISVDINGKDDDLSGLEDFEARVVLNARNLELIGDLLELEIPLPPVGPVTATTTLRGYPGALGAEELVFHVGQREEAWLELDGSIGDLAAFKQLHLVAKFGAPDLQHARSFVDHELPDVGPIRGNITLSDRDDTLGIEMLRIGGGREGTLEVDFSGSIDDLLEHDEIELDTKIEVKHLAIVGSLFGVELPPIGPVSFSGHLTSDDDRVTAQGRTRLDDTAFVGELSGSFAAESRRKLQVRIRSEHIRLEDVGIEPRSDRPEKENVEGAGAGNWWSGNAPLPFFQELRALDADIALQADRVTGRSGFELKHQRLEIQLDDGNLVISADGVDHQMGTVRVEARVGARTAVPSLALKARVDNVDIATLAAQLKEDTESAGFLDALLDLESRGSTPAEIRSNLAGSSRLVLKEAALATQYGRAFVKNVARVSLPSLISHRSPQFGCIVADFQIADGVATVDHLYLDSKKVHVVGSGVIDIGSDTFDLTLQPKAKQPGLLNIAAIVDVTGPLAAPIFNPRLHTVPGNVARGLISNALAPGSVLLRSFRHRAEADALCADGLPIKPLE